jgi:hypothetical protein
MLPSLNESVTFSEVKSIPKSVQLQSYIGHKDLAAILNLPFNRQTITLKRGEKFIIAQYIGPRLSEGTTKLPVNASIKYVIGEIYKTPSDIEYYLDD